MDGDGVSTQYGVKQVCIAHRNHYFRIFQHSDTDDNKCLFATARNNCKRVIRDAKSEYERNVHDRLTVTDFPKDWLS